MEATLFTPDVIPSDQPCWLPWMRKFFFLSFFFFPMIVTHPVAVTAWISSYSLLQLLARQHAMHSGDSLAPLVRGGRTKRGSLKSFCCLQIWAAQPQLAEDDPEPAQRDPTSEPGHQYERAANAPTSPLDFNNPEVAFNAKSTFQLVRYSQYPALVFHWVEKCLSCS